MGEGGRAREGREIKQPSLEGGNVSGKEIMKYVILTVLYVVLSEKGGDSLKEND